MTTHRINISAVNNVKSLEARRIAIDKSAIDDIDRQILILRHVKMKSFNYIADTLGYSTRQIGRRYAKALAFMVSNL